MGFLRLTLAQTTGWGATGRPVALAGALLAAAIWGSSFVGVKAALDHTGPLTVAGLRYFLAFLLFVPLLWRRPPALPAGAWPRLALIGIAQYTVGNAALFWSLGRLSATAGSLSLSLVPIVVLLLEIAWLGARPGGVALLGVALSVGGASSSSSPRSRWAMRRRWGPWRWRSSRSRSSRWWEGSSLGTSPWGRSPSPRSRSGSGAGSSW